MDIETGRANHIEDVLTRLHIGQWFTWSDFKNKIYENLIIHDPEKVAPENKVIWGSWPTEKPTQEFLESELKKLQDDFDAQEYARNRASSSGYPSIPDQLDEIYHNGINSWKAVIKVTKDKYPKG